MSNLINYKNESLRQAIELGKQNPTYSLGQILFSWLQKDAVKNGQSLSFLLDMTDETLYTNLEKAQTRENE
jgi:hypothetical protein